MELNGDVSSTTGNQQITTMETVGQFIRQQIFRKDTAVHRRDDDGSRLSASSLEMDNDVSDNCLLHLIIKLENIRPQIQPVLDPFHILIILPDFNQLQFRYQTALSPI